MEFLEGAPAVAVLFERGKTEGVVGEVHAAHPAVDLAVVHQEEVRGETVGGESVPVRAQPAPLLILTCYSHPKNLRNTNNRQPKTHEPSGNTPFGTTNHPPG
jgi:hypothetical protein